MRLFQPAPRRWSQDQHKSNRFLVTPYPLYNVQSRYQHHATASGYDQLSRYLGETLDIRRLWHVLGETVLRPFCLAQSRWTNHREYSRYDCAFEIDLMSRMRASNRSVYHFLYSEKGYRLCRHAKRDHVLVGTVHHPVSHHARIFGSMKHFASLDVVFVLSKDSVEPWREIVGHDQVFFVPHGVDCDYYFPSDDYHDRLIVFCGYHERDHETLAKVADNLLPRRRDWTLLMITSDRRCEGIASRHPNARIVSRLSNSEYIETLRRAAVMLLPLRESTACNATLEALACGVPVITSSSGMQSYVTESCGYVAEVGDVSAMTYALERYMDNEERLCSAKVRARETAMRFDWPVVAREIARHIVTAWER